MNENLTRHKKTLMDIKSLRNWAFLSQSENAPTLKEHSQNKSLVNFSPGKALAPANDDKTKPTLEQADEISRTKRRHGTPLVRFTEEFDISGEELATQKSRNDIFWWAEDN